MCLCFPCMHLFPSCPHDCFPNLSPSPHRQQNRAHNPHRWNMCGGCFLLTGGSTPFFHLKKKHRQSQWRNSSHMFFFPGHIPYRNSRLTMLLKDSLGGDAKVQGPRWCFLGMGCWVCDFITFNKTNSSPLKINNPKHQFEGAVLVSGMVDIWDFPGSNTCGTPVRRLSHVINKLNL